MMGDFNAIKASSERSRSEGNLLDRVNFENWINDLGLIDMGFLGALYMGERK